MKQYITLKNLGWLVTALVCFMLGMSGVSKLIGTDEMVGNFTFMNLLPYMRLLGVVELLGVAFLIIPQTSRFGAIVLSCYLSGAIAIHLALMGGQGALVPYLLGLGAWVAHCLRNDEYKLYKN